MIQGRFQLHKWITTFKNLQKHINENYCKVNSESYVKKVLAVEWDVSKDEFIFTFSEIIETVELFQVTKRNILKNISYVL